MEQGKTHEMFQESWAQFEDFIKKNDDCEKCPSSSTSSVEGSMISNRSSKCPSNDAEDGSSSSTSSLTSNQTVYDLSEIMAQLPIKRGLSKFYQGKSESFTSLSRVTTIEDLAKRTHTSKVKASKKFGKGLLNSYRNYTLPKAIIAKESTRSSISPCFPTKRGTIMRLRTSPDKNLQS